MNNPILDFIVIFIIIALIGWAMEANSACVMSYCKDRSSVTSPAPGERQVITNNRRQRVGDVYNPGTGRIQIRDAQRRIIGYIEPNGWITNIRRQKIGEINE
jgi:hypothetical protein